VLNRNGSRSPSTTATVIVLLLVLVLVVLVVLVLVVLVLVVLVPVDDVEVEVDVDVTPTASATPGMSTVVSIPEAGTLTILVAILLTATGVVTPSLSTKPNPAVSSGAESTGWNKTTAIVTSADAC
jgi:hypothetical protein